MKQLLLSLPVRFKLMLANWMIIIVPIIVVALLIPICWLWVMKVDLHVQRQVIALLPSPINGAIVQNSTRVLYKDLSKSKKDISDFYFQIRLLEMEGMDIVLMQNNTILYTTPGASPDYILAEGTAYNDSITARAGQAALLKKQFDMHKNPSLRYDLDIDDEYEQSKLGNKKIDNGRGSKIRRLDWNGDEVTYVVEYPKAWSLYGYGNAPFLARVMGDSDEKDIVEDIIVGSLIGFAVFILAFSAFMGYRVSRWIVKPLEELQVATRHIQEGDFTKEIIPMYADELGATTLSFDMMRRKLLYQKNKQDEMEHKRREMIGGICHDLATPLTSISGYAQGLKDGIATTEEKKNKYIDIIISQARILERLVERLSDFSRFELGHLAIHNEILDINYFVVDWVKGYVASHTEIPIRLNIERDTTPLLVSFDPAQFTRVLMNLVENSIKYRKGNDVTLELSIMRKGNKVRIELGDHGIGVSESDMASVFDIFYRTDSARSDVKNGSGIGLAVVKQIIESFEGTVEAKSNAYKGLTICMELPLHNG